MAEVDVALVTCRDPPEPDPDAAPLAAALAAAGIAVRTVAWDDPACAPEPSRLTIFRSCWNYHRRHEAFLEWTEARAARSQLWNPLPVVRWNVHKRYLLDLERRGVAIAPTALVPAGSGVTLRALLAKRGWDDVVVKPAVSAASFRTQRVRASNRDAGEAHLRELLAERDVLVQHYVPSVEDHGERALIWIDGELTHAVRKSPRFAGQEEAVSARAVPISPAEAELARRAVAAVAGPLLYARVDVAPGPGGAPLLMELELIEPSLYFLQHPPALARFVAGIRRRLDDRPPSAR